MPLKIARKRIAASFIILLALGSLLVARLLYIQVVESSSLSRSALLEQSAHQLLLPDRGDIYDRNGGLLALEAKADAIYAIPRDVQSPASEALVLAPLLHLSVSTVRRDLSGTSWFAWIAQGVPLGTGQEIANLNLPGVSEQLEDWRTYPEGNLAGPVLGFVGESQQGLAGLELSYNRQLSGKPGQIWFRTDALGNPLPTDGAREMPSSPGDALHLTLDSTIQSYAQRDLQQAIAKTRSHSGRILVLNPQDSAVLAMAQWPSPNPNDWQAASLSEWANQSVQYVYPPGSTFKAVTASAALASGEFSMNSRFYDPGYKIVTGHRINEWNPAGFGWLDFTGIMQWSSDVGFMDIGLKLGVPLFYHYLQAFHLLSPTGIGLPGEANTVIQPPSQVRPMDLATMAFGQTLALTPLQVAAAVSAVANGGVWHRPYIVQDITATDGTVVYQHHSTAARAVTTAVASAVTQAMTAVITKGTGTLAAVEGYTLAGKTGTSQVPGAAGYIPGRYIGSFIGFGPLPHPTLLILIQLDHPIGLYYGGDIAAPVFHTLMAQCLHYLGIAPSQPTAAAVQSVKVPWLTGLSVPVATKDLLQLGLSPSFLGEGVRIMGQSPAPGAQTHQGTTVTLVTARLSGHVVPDVYGETLRLATSTLIHSGYRVSFSGSGAVVAERPSQGTSLRPGSLVRLTLNTP